jgi:hypothetical protein
MNGNRNNHANTRKAKEIIKTDVEKMKEVKKKIGRRADRV